LVQLFQRETDSGCYTHAGPEIGVASTKAFTAQVTVLTLMALTVAQKRNAIQPERLHRLIAEINSIPDKVEQALKSNDIIEHISKITKTLPTHFT